MINKLNKKTLQKKLLYRSKKRGCLETDYIFTEFAESFLFKMDLQTLNQYALVLDQNDNDLYNWISNKLPIPSNINPKIIHELRKIAKPHIF